MSKAPPRMPMPCCTLGAVPGTMLSGVVVASTRLSISSGVLPARGERRLGRLDGQARGRASDVALPDAGALDDPLVAGVEAHGHVVVGDHLVRHRDAPTGDADPLHAADPARTAWMPTKPASP